jgi:hypothetical protein
MCYKEAIQYKEGKEVCLTFIFIILISVRVIHKSNPNHGL